jgi:hypothetical protein
MFDEQTMGGSAVETAPDGNEPLEVGTHVTIDDRPGEWVVKEIRENGEIFASNEESREPDADLEELIVPENEVHPI